MNNSSWFTPQVPESVSTKVIAAAVMSYLLMILLAKVCATLLYGSSASHAVLSQAIMVFMPSMLIGIGLLSAQAASMTWKQLIYRTIAIALLGTTVTLAGLPIFFH